ncbi:MAG: hypothetical protein JWM41_426 [Gemmatimonadetes bacterium]|nr:hypothetical protein [Gemmatimonadota bacterium]
MIGEGPTAAVREFTDRAGVLWRVSVVHDTHATDAGPRERRANARSAVRDSPKAKRLGTRPLELPWLCFESRTERRRVSPAPSGWEELAEDELEDLMGNSQLL